MKGPTPKDPALRQRVNKVAGATKLSVVTEESLLVPDLPKRHKWHPLTLAWWNDVWQSPMAPEYLQSDIHGLYLLAELVNRFWRKPSVALAIEIRLQRTCFGLTPIDRRRLQWEIEKAEDAARKRTKRELPPKTGDDPRTLLQAVK